MTDLGGGIAVVGTNKTVRLKNVTRDGVPVTILGGGESITYTVLKDKAGVVYQPTAAAEHDGSNPGTWLGTVTMPESDELLHVHWTVVKGGITEKFHYLIRVVGEN